ncbi:MAG: enoyl-CoA hydratase [Microthrixaceae bacterium]
MTHIRVERNDDGVGVITLDDQARRNALSLGLCEELTEAVSSLEEDPTIGALVVTGAAPAFCAGADLTQLGDSAEDGLRQIYDGFLSVARTTLPSIAAVNGPAVGAGLNLALACDLRLAAESARFDCRFLDLGIHPGGGHTWMLRRLVGPQVCAAMVLFGEVLDSTAALHHGLVWETTTDDGLLSRAIELAAHAASVPRDLSVATKATLAEVADVSEHDAAVDLELAKQLTSMDQPEFVERLTRLRARVHGSS